MRYDLEHLDQTTPERTTVTDALRFVTSSAGFFHDEDLRQVVLHDTLESLLRKNVRWREPIAGGVAKPDGVLFEGPFAYLIFELENEPGLGGDPFLKGLAVYTKLISQQKEVCHLSIGCDVAESLLFL